MKNLFLFIFILLSIFSCKQKNETHDKMVLEELKKIDAEIDSINLKSFEKSIEETAIGGEGIIFEDGKMSFNIESLEDAAKDIEEKLNDIKKNNSYKSEEIKQNAIRSMKLNLNLFIGDFCCTTHNGTHCEDSKQLRKLFQEFKCNRFVKKL